MPIDERINCSDSMRTESLLFRLQTHQHMSSSNVIVIPARLESTRLPKKLLLRETGKTLIEHTYRAAQSSTKASRVIVAADNQQIVAEVKSFGGEAVLTDPNHPSGTDRVAEVARSLKEARIIVNVQGDEPEIAGEAIDRAIGLLEQYPESLVSTLATPIHDQKLIDDPNCVKVVMNGAGQAITFSRSRIPHPRDWNEDLLKESPAIWHQHLGLYAYRRSFLLEINAIPNCRLSEIESLEQLKFLHAGYPIEVGTIEHACPGIDTAEDYAAFVNRQAK